MNNILQQLGFVFGTILLLIASIAWVDLLAYLKNKYGISQIIFTICLTLITLCFFIFLKPFNNEESKTPPGIEKAIFDDRMITFPLINDF